MDESAASTLGTSPRLTFERITCATAPVTLRLSRYNAPGGVDELHLMAEPKEYAPVNVQLDWLAHGYREALAAVGTDEGSAVFRRLFCSDPVNQAAALRSCALAQTSSSSSSNASNTSSAVSIVGQPPVGCAKVALWAMHLCAPATPLDKHLDGDTLSLRRGELTHHWTSGYIAPDAAGSHDQTRSILNNYVDWLSDANMNLADHVLRTWFFVRDIDVNYRGLVDARRVHFADHGLIDKTHYIASSGIAGEVVDNRALVSMDAYAIAGVQPRQICYLKARDHLSSTHIYGVTFERATAIDYRDRRHILLSGTASIDRSGKVVHPGDVYRQLHRTMENIAALLDEGGAGVQDVNHWIVYLRDTSDAPLITQAMRERISDAPMIVLTAPVCRSGWMVEIEGMATVGRDNAELPAF